MGEWRYSSAFLDPTDKKSALKVPMQCTFALLTEVGWREGKAL
jgi:hypothetical protein